MNKHSQKIYNKALIPIRAVSVKKIHNTYFPSGGGRHNGYTYTDGAAKDDTPNNGNFTGFGGFRYGPSFPSIYNYHDPQPVIDALIDFADLANRCYGNPVAVIHNKKIIYVADNIVVDVEGRQHVTKEELVELLEQREEEAKLRLANRKSLKFESELR